MVTFRSIILLPILFALLALGACSNRIEQRSLQGGAIDLSSWKPEQDAPILHLSGTWQFVMGSSLTGDEAAWASAKSVYFPGSWPQSVAGQGFVSLRARLVLPVRDDLALRIQNTVDSARVYINGQLRTKSGEPSLEEAISQPSRKPMTLNLDGLREVEIIIQIANYHNAQGGWYFPLIIAPLDTLEAQVASERMLEVAFAAAILSIGIYHLLLAIIRRNRLALIFAICCSLVACRTLASNHHVIDDFLQLGWAASYRLEFGSLYMIAPAMELFFYYLFPKEYPKRLIPPRFLLFGLCLMTVALPISTMVSYLWWVHTHHIFTMSIVVYILVQASRKGRIGSYWIIVGSTAMIFFAMFDIYKSYINISGGYLIHVGFLAFIISQAAAIAQQYNELYRKLIDEQSHRKHSFSQLGKLVYPHQLHLMEQGLPLESTMPTGPGRGCVICFDIVGSTKIKHVNRTGLFKDIFSRCYEKMLEGYEEKDLTATAYRIKENGDGFLCSVGYPFKIPGQQEPAIFATLLALTFRQIFTEYVRTLNYPHPLHCAISVACGDLEGYFPSSGTREYDLFGHAIVLATRYERIRKKVFKDGLSGSVVILQEDVYLSLPAEVRNRFQKYDLIEHQLRIRDDISAKALYFDIDSQGQGAAA